MSEKDAARVDAANRLTAVVCRICRLAIRCNVSWVIENPLTSRLWQVPEVKRLMGHALVQLCRYDFCAWGAPWRKATRLLSYCMPELHAAAVHCNSTGGICSFSRKPHFILQGSDPAGVFWTARSEPYPPRLCSCWAKHIRSSIVENHLQKISAHK